MKKIWKILIFAVCVLVIAALSFGIYSTYQENKKLSDFIEENYNVDLECWNGEKLVSEESNEVSEVSQLVEEESSDDTTEKLIKFIETYFKVDIDDWDGEDFINKGEEIHEIYDDTAVVEAYHSGDASKLSEQDKYVLDTASEIIDELIEDAKTEYEKELAVYNWQVEYVSYNNSHFDPIPSDEEEYSDIPYGVLKNHSAICVGNATTFKLFMDMLDIECQIIHSTDCGEHAWDLVKIDGDWYHVDVTFDGSEDGNPIYSNFNVPDSVKNDGTWPYNTSDFPKATATKYCYIYNNCSTVDSIYDVPALLYEAITNDEAAVFFILNEETEWNYDSFDYIGTTLSDDETMITYVDTLQVGDKMISGYFIWNYDYETPNWEDEGKEIDYDKMQDIIDSLISQG